MSDFTMEIMDVTPELSRTWLQRNKANRYISMAKARQYAKDMKNGNWQLSPEGISFDKEGNIINGQHRLTAIDISGVTVRMAIYRNVETTVFDRGRLRTVSNILEMNGMPRTIANSRITGAVNFLFSEVVGNRTNRLTDAQMELFFETNIDILSDVRRIARSGGNSLTDNSVGCAAVFCALFSGISDQVLQRFFEIVNTGYYSYNEETAAITLRNYLLEAKGKDLTKYMPLAHEAFSQTLSAINGYIKRKPRVKKYPTMETPYYFQKVREYIELFFVE